MQEAIEFKSYAQEGVIKIPEGSGNFCVAWEFEFVIHNSMHKFFITH